MTLPPSSPTRPAPCPASNPPSPWSLRGRRGGCACRAWTRRLLLPRRARRRRRSRHVAARPARTPSSRSTPTCFPGRPTGWPWTPPTSRGRGGGLSGRRERRRPSQPLLLPTPRSSPTRLAPRCRRWRVHPLTMMTTTTTTTTMTREWRKTLHPPTTTRPPTSCPRPAHGGTAPWGPPSAPAASVPLWGRRRRMGGGGATRAGARARALRWLGLWFLPPLPPGPRPRGHLLYLGGRSGAALPAWQPSARRRWCGATAALRAPRSACPPRARPLAACPGRRHWPRGRRRWACLRWGGVAARGVCPPPPRQAPSRSPRRRRGGRGAAPPEPRGTQTRGPRRRWRRGRE